MKEIFRPKPLVRIVPLGIPRLGDKTPSRQGIYSEWLLTNGLGGYASGTAGGINTRRFHGWLIAALPAPHGRTMMVNYLRERFYMGEKCFELNFPESVSENGLHTDDKSGRSEEHT